MSCLNDLRSGRKPRLSPAAERSDGPYSAESAAGDFQPEEP